MQQIHRRTPMPKCDFNKVALQLYWNRTSSWVFSRKFAAYIQNTFSLEHLWTAASVNEENKSGSSVNELWMNYIEIMTAFRIRYIS